MARDMIYQYFAIDRNLDKPGAFGVYDKKEDVMQAQSSDNPLLTGPRVGEALALSEKNGPANARLVEALEKRMRSHGEDDYIALARLLHDDENFQKLWEEARRERLALSEKAQF